MGTERDNVGETQEKRLKEIIEETEGKDRRDNEDKSLGVQLVWVDRETSTLVHIQESKLYHSHLHEVIHVK